MKNPKKRGVTFAFAEGFEDSLDQSVLEGSPEYERYETFITSKSKIPPQRLPGTMKDHRLDGSLNEFKECHLSGNVLLIYTHENDIVTLFRVCDHDTIHGKRGTRFAKNLKKLPVKKA